MPEEWGDHRMRRRGELAWFEPGAPLGGRVRIAFSTRSGGHSPPPYRSLNLGFHVGDRAESVRLNRRDWLAALGRPLLEPAAAHQVHGARVAPAGALHAGANWQTEEQTLRATDGLATDTLRMPLAIQVADCLPIAVADPVHGALVAAHAGWRGLAGGLLEQAVAQLAATWGTNPADCAAWIGPGIGACCYEVGEDVARQFPGASIPSGSAWRLDLRGEALRRLRGVGLVEENLVSLDLCTSCRPELFFSHRRDTGAGAGATGRMMMLAWLEPEPPASDY